MGMFQILDMCPQRVPFSVSVVIPTYKRHVEVVRAIRSALGQTAAPLEVIVVNDGSDSIKGKVIEDLDDSRVVFYEAPRHGSASATRNYGIERAKGEWIALLDDDDIWFHKKLETQYSALRHSGHSEAILAGVEMVYDENKLCHLRPAQEVPFDTSVDEVLFCGYGGVHTSTLMAPKWAFEKYPFDEELERHEDWSWMLHAAKELKLVVTPESICSRHLAPGEGLSRPGGYVFSRLWYEQHKELISPKARASFVSNILSRKAAHDGNLVALPWLVGEIARHRGFNVRNFVHLLTPWIVPTSARQLIKSTRIGK